LLVWIAMTDLELARVIRDAAAALRTSPRSDWPATRAALAELAQLVAAPRPGVHPVVVKLSIHEPVGPIRSRVVEPPLPAVVEDYVIRILDAPPRLGETIEAGYCHKEHELGALFADLTPQEARALRRRLAAQVAGDRLAARFSRLAPDRRARLLTFLGDARRREALRQAAA
jgi:hypothetical protein